MRAPKVPPSIRVDLGAEDPRPRWQRLRSARPISDPTIQAAVEAEREACAALVESLSCGGLSGLSSFYAEKIRARGTGDDE